MSHAGHAHVNSGAAPAAGQKDDDDPNQVDTIVLGDPEEPTWLCQLSEE
ncbi:MAG: hypothetical protein WCD57_06855 [Acidobacteriaceae bacterium]